MPRALGRRTAPALLALALAGCSTTASSGSSVTATGRTLHIYLSEPARADAVQAATIAAEQQACTRDAGEVTRFTVVCKVVQRYEPSANARTAIQDKSAIAYIGELAPGTSDGTVGITNALDLLQVSPTDTALELTRSSPVITGAPDKYYESKSTYGRTFARAAPGGVEEATATAAEMSALKVSSVYVASDRSDYGKAIAAAVGVAARAASISIAATASGAGAVFYGSDSPAAAAQWFDKNGSGGGVKLFAPSGLATSSFATALSPSLGQSIYLAVPKPAQTVAGVSGPAAFGYVAVDTVFQALKEAGSAANNRGLVAADLLTLHNSPLGAGSFVFDQVSAGALVPAKHRP